MSKANQPRLIGQLIIIKELYGDVSYQAGELAKDIIKGDAKEIAERTRKYMDAAEKVKELQMAEDVPTLQLNLVPENY